MTMLTQLVRLQLPDTKQLPKSDWVGLLVCHVARFSQMFVFAALET